MSADRLIVASEVGAPGAGTRVVPIVEWVAMKEFNRALDRLRKIQVRYRVVSANGAGRDS